jgi:DNA-binding beta-propeller fold protein YncE
MAGCTASAGGSSRAEAVWGERGIAPGKLQKPRAMCIDADDLLYIVDITARIQVFDGNGKFLRGWRTPESKNGRPTGMSIINGRLYVADTHYFRVLVYNLDGKLREDLSFGQPGQLPGNLGWTTDVVRDSAGVLYVSEYGQHDRIQKFTPEGNYLLHWGTHGTEPGQFMRPQNMWVDKKDQIWVCDAGNHRLQVFDTQGKFLFTWGQEGSEPGKLSYPYCMLIDPQDNVVVCEFGNSRVQKFDQQGNSLATWGSQGREPGQLFNPWAIVQDSHQKTFVLDSYNHRVQRFVI